MTGSRVPPGPLEAVADQSTAAQDSDGDAVRFTSDFNESWSPIGTELAASPDPIYIQLEVHLASQGTESLFGVTVPLTSGATATGDLSSNDAFLAWSYEGMGLKVISHGVDPAQVLQFINSLKFPTP